MILHQRQLVRSSDELSQQSSLLLTKLNMNWVVWEITDRKGQSERDAILEEQECHSQEEINRQEVLSASSDRKSEGEPVTHLSGCGSQSQYCDDEELAVSVVYHRTSTDAKFKYLYFAVYWDFPALAEVLIVKESKAKCFGFYRLGYLEVSRGNREYTEIVEILSLTGIYQLPNLEQLFELDCGYFLTSTQGIEDMPLTRHLLYSHGITYQVITGIGLDPVEGFKTNTMVPYINVGRKELESWLQTMIQF